LIKPKIQLALDTTDLDCALQAAWELHDYVDIIEAGTHLLLAEGLRCVSLLRKLFPEKILLADTKIIDSGDVLTAAACAAGADVVTVVGAASQPTILKAADTAHAAGKQVLLDHLSKDWNTPDILAKSMLDVDGIGLHLPKDLQDSSRLDFDTLRKALLNFSTPTYLAGGVEPDLVRKMVGLPIGGFVVGNYLLKGPNRVEKARELKNIIDQWDH
jgi:3-keto-L-gulonate-6-phosphate decarboxylase